MFAYILGYELMIKDIRLQYASKLSTCKMQTAIWPSRAYDLDLPSPISGTTQMYSQPIHMIFLSLHAPRLVIPAASSLGLR